jgi:hypothetical protein
VSRRKGGFRPSEEKEKAASGQAKKRRLPAWRRRAASDKRRAASDKKGGFRQEGKGGFRLMEKGGLGLTGYCHFFPDKKNLFCDHCELFFCDH